MKMFVYRTMSVTALALMLTACATQSPVSDVEPPRLPPAPESLKLPLPEPGMFSKRAQTNIRLWQQMLTQP